MAAELRVDFVLGTGRCGSTLVHEVLARHPDVAFLSNLEDRFPLPPAAGRWNNRVYRSLPASFTRKGRVRFAPSEGYHALDREVAPALSTPERDLLADDATPWLADRTRRFFEQRVSGPGPARLRPQAHRLASRRVPRPGLPRRPVRPRGPRRPRGGELVPPDAVVAWLRGAGRVGVGPLSAEDRADWEAPGAVTRSWRAWSGSCWSTLRPRGSRAPRRPMAGGPLRGVRRRSPRRSWPES